MFIVSSSMSRGAVRRAGTQPVLNHSTSLRARRTAPEAYPRQCYRHDTPTGVKTCFESLILLAAWSKTNKQRRGEISISSILDHRGTEVAQRKLPRLSFLVRGKVG